MSIFDLQRLEGGIRRFEFPARDGGSIAVFAHIPTAEEYAASIAESGADLQGADKMDLQSKEAVELSAKLGAAKVNLACYCVEEVEGYEIKRVKGPFGLRRLSEESEDALSPVLRKIGDVLYEAANLSKEEGER